MQKCIFIFSVCWVFVGSSSKEAQLVFFWTKGCSFFSLFKEPRSERAAAAETFLSWNFFYHYCSLAALGINFHQAILFIQHGGHFQEDSKKRKKERKKSFVGFEREREEEREQSDARTDRKTTEINGMSWLSSIRSWTSLDRLNPSRAQTFEFLKDSKMGSFTGLGFLVSLAAFSLSLV